MPGFFRGVPIAEGIDDDAAGDGDDYEYDQDSEQVGLAVGEFVGGHDLRVCLWSFIASGKSSHSGAGFSTARATERLICSSVRRGSPGTQR